MKIVVTFALESEFARWRRVSRFERVSGASVPTYLVRRREAEVYAVLTGVGMRSVQNELRDLLSKSADFCISSGLAGGLRNEHRAGAILVAKAVKTSGTDREIKTDDCLVEAAGQCGAVAADFFFTSNAIVNSPAEKLRLGEIAAAVDLESFRVLREAEEFGVPAVAVRALSDAVETNMAIDFNRIIDHRGQMAWLPALHQIARAPKRVPELIRFGFESSRAARHLAHFLDRYVQVLIGTFRIRDASFELRRAETK